MMSSASSITLSSWEHSESDGSDASSSDNEDTPSLPVYANVRRSQQFYQRGMADLVEVRSKSWDVEARTDALRLLHLDDAREVLFPCAGLDGPGFALD